MPLPRIEREIPGSYQIDALLRGRRLQRAWHRARLDLVACVLPPAGRSPSLDVAAGSGIITWRFRRAPIVSVDMRLDACRAIRDHTPGARAVVAELGRLPFGSAIFSQVYLLETLEHLTAEEGRRILSEVRRVSRPGARILITTPNYRSHWIVWERLIDRFRLTPALADGQHVSRYDSGELARAVETTGWRVLRLGSFNLFAPFAGMASARAAKWAVEIEASAGGRTGALLYALCEAPA